LLSKDALLKSVSARSRTKFPCCARDRHLN
jgi:hypothetical protein